MQYNVVLRVTTLVKCLREITEVNEASNMKSKRNESA